MSDQALAWISLLITFIGTAVGVFGVAFAMHERRKRLSLENKTRSQQWATLDRARYVVGDHVLFKQFDDQLAHPLKHRLWTIHQAACDLYISLVEQYLSSVDRFTYDDLKRLVSNGAIYWRWQEQQWRLLICERPENRDVQPPEYFVTEPQNNPFRAALDTVGAMREPEQK